MMQVDVLGHVGAEFTFYQLKVKCANSCTCILCTPLVLMYS